MLGIDAEQMDALDAYAEDAFAEQLRHELCLAQPGFLPRFPRDQQSRIVGNLISWARVTGATWQSSTAFLAALMLTFGGGVATSVLVLSRLPKNGADRNAAILRLRETVPAEDWLTIASGRTDMPLFVGPGLFKAPHEERTAAALSLVTLGIAHRARAAAASGLSEARALGWDGLDDAGFVLGAAAHLYGMRFSQIDASWRADILSARSPHESLSMLRARAMLDHGRRL